MEGEDIEIWKPIAGYSNYEVSNMGKVRRNKKTIFMGTKENDGYVRVGLTKDKKSRKFKMHRLVAMTFIPNPENKPEVNHLGEKHDNRVCMLEWATSQENSLHGAQKNRNTNKDVIINQIDKESNEIIKTYRKYNEIINDGFNIDKVRLCLKGKNKTHQGFKWVNGNVIQNRESNQTYENEIWKSLKDSIFEEVKMFENYKISNYGRVRGYRNKLLCPNKTAGAFIVQLRQLGDIKYMRVHRLVLMAFNVQRPEGKNEVDHIDSNPYNNKLDNLRWADRQIQIENENTKAKKTIKIKVINKDSEKIYDGIKAMSKEIKISMKKIYKCISENIEFKGYKFEIIDDTNKRTLKRQESISKKSIEIVK